LLNVLAGFERTEGGVAAEGSSCAGRSPAQLASENLLTASLRRSGCFPAESCPPERHWRVLQGQVVVARLFEELLSRDLSSLCRAIHIVDDLMTGD
jgi:hypothetical protein